MQRPAPHDGSPDTHALISAAAEEVARAGRPRAPAAVRSSIPARAILAVLAAGAAVAAVALNSGELRRLADAVVPGAEASKERRAFVEVLERAYAEVEAERVATGRIPDAIPRASLGTLVAYRPGTNDYRLSIDTGTVVLEMDRVGNLTERPSR